MRREIEKYGVTPQFEMQRRRTRSENQQGEKLDFFEKEEEGKVGDEVES